MLRVVVIVCRCRKLALVVIRFVEVPCYVLLCVVVVDGVVYHYLWLLCVVVLCVGVVLFVVVCLFVSLCLLLRFVLVL